MREGVVGNESEAQIPKDVTDVNFYVPSRRDRGDTESVCEKEKEREFQTFQTYPDSSGTISGRPRFIQNHADPSRSIQIHPKHSRTVSKAGSKAS